eukprot:m.85784 g.85784  ORF g.85784 m.85784 type:complete len:162 (-) comp12786_c3_seq1:327-812(-)
MIQSVLIFNTGGKARLIKTYTYMSEEEEQKLVRECFQLVSKRSMTACNFLEAGSLGVSGDTKLIYRNFATLFFVFAVDSSESELAIIDLIQVFVEVLDRVFKNVCELDIVFHIEKVHHILDEIVMGGLMLEARLEEILATIEAQDKALSAERSIFSPGKTP